MQMRCKSYMFPICIWPVYGIYMYMASIWDLNVSTVNSYNPLIRDLQGTYIGLTIDI